jgi:hypothetical protein
MELRTLAPARCQQDSSWHLCTDLTLIDGLEIDAEA